LNNSINPNTGFSPYTMVYGADHALPSFLETEPTAVPHFSVRPNKERIKALTKEIDQITKTAQDKLPQIRMKASERVNKARKDSNFKPGDYLFIIDRSIIPGNPRVLRTKLSPSPYICVRSLFTTSIVQRLSDGFTSVYSNSDLKKYDKVSPLFNSLPVEVTKVLLNSFKDLLDADLCTIAAHDPLNIPDKAIPLFDTDSSQIEVVNGEIVNGKVAQEPEEISLDTPLQQGDDPVQNTPNDEFHEDDDDANDPVITNDLFQDELEETGEVDSDNDDYVDTEQPNRLSLLREIESDRKEEEKRRLEKISEEEEEEEEAEEEMPTGRANNRPTRFGRIYQK